MISSRLSPKVEIRDKSLNGKGIFAKEDIKKDEIVFIKGGHILTRNEIFSSGIINSYFPISDEYFLGTTNKDEEDAIKLYQNHSCNPNVGLHGEITFVAMRDIKKYEDLSLNSKTIFCIKQIAIPHQDLDFKLEDYYIIFDQLDIIINKGIKSFYTINI